KERRQALERTPGIRGVMEYADAVDQVKGLGTERQLEHARLNGPEAFVVREVRPRGVHGVAQIDPDDTAAPAKHDVGIAAHATAHIKHQPAADVIGSPACHLGEGAFGYTAVPSVELGRPMHGPLVAEIARVLIVRHESGNPVANEIASAAPAA